MLWMHSMTRAGGATDADHPPQTTATSGDAQVVLDVIAAVQARDRGGTTWGKDVLREQLDRAPEGTVVRRRP